MIIKSITTRHHITPNITHRSFHTLYVFKKHHTHLLTPTKASLSPDSAANTPHPDWRQRSKPIPPGSSSYPAKHLCSSCGLCDTYYIAHVKHACAFLGDGMSSIPAMETKTHGRSRNLDDPDELRFGVLQDTFFARATPSVPGAQWTGLVTSIATQALTNGLVEAVVCVASDPNDRFTPVPILATTPEQVRQAAGVKPTLSPNLNVLAKIEESGYKKILFIGVGCQVQALRKVEQHLNLDKLYVLGTNCTDNGVRQGLDKFLNAASTSPDTVLHYEFMCDYRVHLKHMDGSYETVPYFCLPAAELSEGVIAPACMSCFDYTNAGADIVVGYMGVPPNYTTTDDNKRRSRSRSRRVVPMTQHYQWLMLRNKRGEELLNQCNNSNNVIEKIAATSGGSSRRPFVMQTVIADDEAKLGRGPKEGAPRWLGEVLATVLTWIGPKGLEFAKYSIDYHYIRNWLYVMRDKGGEDKGVPEYVKRIVDEYDGGAVRKRVGMEKEKEKKRVEG